MYTLFATSTEHIVRYAITCAHSPTASAYNASICDASACAANARIRIASHANAFLMRHARIRIRYLGVFRVSYARIRMRCERIRIACARIRIACDIRIEFIPVDRFISRVWITGQRDRFAGTWNAILTVNGTITRNYDVRIYVNRTSD